MIKKIALISVMTFVWRLASLGATVDTVNTYSTAMHKNIKAVVIIPERYDQQDAYPVVYILHGFGGKYADWIKGVPAIAELADHYEMIIVCADGNVSSWYLDSPVQPDWKYETYTATELVQYIDQHYKTIKKRTGRAITGLSMGGHGAFYLAFKHQDVYGAAGSMSGGVDLRPFPNNWNLSARLGVYAQNPDNWDQNSVINLTYLLTPNSLALIFDCGTEDFFFKVNQNLHEKLLERNIPHDFIVRPGAHNWAYWSNAVEYQLMFFNNYFHKKIIDKK